MTSRPGRGTRDAAYVAALLVVDLFAVYESWVVAYNIRASSSLPVAHPISIARFAALVAVLLPVWALIFAAFGLYSIRQRPNAASEFGRILVGVVCGVMVLIVLDFLRPDKPILPARSVPIYAVLVGTAFVVVGRFLVRLVRNLLYRRQVGLHNIVVIGSGAIAERMLAELARRGSGYRLIGRVCDATDAADVPVFAGLADALRALPKEIDAVFQAQTDLNRKLIESMIEMTNAAGITYRFVPDHYGVYAAASTLTTFGGVPIMEVRLTTLDGWGAATKQAFDWLMCILVTVVSLPLLGGVALLVKLTDPGGPVFYRQERVGQGGRSIRVWKFRTMSWKYSTGPGRPYDNPADAFRAMGRDDLCEEFARDHKVADDPRITAPGRWLRSTSLDELPQLLNVLRGDLSLIGPRPVTPVELERYGPQQRSLLVIKPGLTGLWQVSGRSSVSYEDRVKLDLYYIENWSIGLDLRILARTPLAVVMRKGAV